MFRLLLFSSLLCVLPLSYTPISSYQQTTAAGWKLYIHKRYFRKGHKHAARDRFVIQIVKQQLAAARKVLPKQAVAALQRVSIWMEYTNACKGNSAVFRSGRPAAFRKRGLHPKKADAIELCGAKIIYDTVHTMPAQLLHELAHAYQTLIMTVDEDKVLARAFAHAKKKGLYRKVKMHKAPPRRAYALIDMKEYFAESTESFFARNNAFPFHRKQLKRYDPVGYQMVIKLWKVRAMPPPYPITYGYSSYRR